MALCSYLLRAAVAPNGSRLSCGRPRAGARVLDEQSVPARAQHSASLKAITARQLQALVRQRVMAPCKEWSVLPRHATLTGGTGRDAATAIMGRPLVGPAAGALMSCEAGQR